MRHRVIGILRGCPFRHVGRIAGAAIGAGLEVIEVTLDSERPLEQIAGIRAAHPEVAVGAGSVRRVEDVAAAVEAGARFIVSPVVNHDVITATLDLGVASIPGAATPTEIHDAGRFGATAVKVFPIEQLGGVGYLAAVLSPLGSPALIPTGGVGVDSVAGYLGAGAVAVGLGGSLFPIQALREGDAVAVEQRARAVLGAVS
jgi:2-dehydro-3-deoxyphosphogluconate aldolase / (4S)-4-hydroxy-2-oxoglutarate aldolase